MHLQLVHKLLRKIGSFTQVNTEILIITVQRWKGQVLIPILEMRKWRNRGEMTCPTKFAELVGAAAKNRSVSACRPRAFCFASVCAVGPTFKIILHWGHAPGTEGVGRVHCHIGPR